MNISDVRLTLYALLSSVEADLRGLLRSQLVPHFSDLSFVQDAEQRDRIAERYSRDHPDLNANADAAGAIEYFDFADAYQVLLQNDSVVPGAYTKELRARAQVFDRLAAVRNRVMHSRPLLAGDFEAVYGFVTDVANASAIEWTSCIQTLTRLSTDPSFVLGLSLPVVRLDESCVYHNLPVPDFDDTGFVGRCEDASEIRKLLLGPNTVVSVIGEGGIGKTALLLKVLYDLVDMKHDCPFDAVIWVSAKTSVLTSSGIQDIRNAISDMTGVVDGVAGALGAQPVAADRRMGEILEYLREFKVLLALDNVETIINSGIRDFIREAQFHCKIAITSRIGLGELEFRWHLDPMRKREATALLRAHAQIRNLTAVLRMKDTKINRILDQLHCNPLAIKWFVHSVNSGRSPDEVIAAKEDLLEYCMSNVYNQLSSPARAVLDAALAARARTSEAELIYYTGMPALEVRQAVNQLLATSFLRRTSRNKVAVEELVYEVNEFAREYLVQKHSPPRKLIESVRRKRDQLLGTSQEARRISEIDEFSVNALAPRNSSERAVSPLLREALSLSRKHHYQEGLAKTDEAKAILAHYFETYRVSAFIRASNDDLLGAESDYKTALDLEPENPRLLYFYAGFLVRHMNEPSAALPYAEKAYLLRPQAIETATLYARCIGYAGDYPRAIELLQHVFDSEASATAKNKKIITTLMMDFHRRHAEDERNIKKEYANAIVSIQAGLNAFRIAEQQGFVDDRILHELLGLFQEYRKAVQKISDDSETQMYLTRVREHREYLRHAGGEYLAEEADVSLPEHAREEGAVNDVRLGTVIERVSERQYAFIQCQLGDRFFFHRSQLADPSHWDAVHNGCLVRFEVGSNIRGTCAVNVRVLDEYEHSERKTDQEAPPQPAQTGKVVQYYPSGAYAFVKTLSGDRYFFHRTGISKGVGWGDLANDALVSFRLGHNEKGVCAVDVALVAEIPAGKGQAHRLIGRVLEYYSDRAYAFLQCPDGSRYFFHKSAMSRGSDWNHLRNSVFASFTLGENTAGVCAIDVAPVESQKAPE